jgi:four helix bundle protein
LFNDFTEMPVWQKAMDAMKAAYDLADKLPKHEQYALSSQLRDAAVSMPGNIAEAFGRQHKKDKLNFYYYSRGSAYETRSHALVAVKVTYVTTEEIADVNTSCLAVIEDFNKIIKALS